jgi:diguanylate cyclase (GGDEF)-like protein
MTPSTETLRTFVTQIVERSGAEAASVYVPTPWADANAAILLHVGSGARPPELESLEAAAAFARTSVGQLPHASSNGACISVVPGRAPHTMLVPIPLINTLWQRASVTRETTRGDFSLGRRQSDRSTSATVAGWIGLTFEHTPLDVPLAWADVLELAGLLAATYVSLYSVLTDPLTGLPGRAELDALLRTELERARTLRQPYALVLINPAGLDAVNERHGRRGGDTVVREVVLRLHQLLRRSDAVMRYGSAVFALSLNDVASDAAVVVGEKLRRHIAESIFLDGTVQIACNVGIATYEPGQDEPIEPFELIRRADQAIAEAKKSLGSRVYLWRRTELEAVSNLDRLLGIFTGNTEKDYRNMGLLWHALEAMTSNRGTEGLARGVVDKLFGLLSPSRVAIVESHGPDLRLAAGLYRDELVRNTAHLMATHDITAQEWALARRACETLQSCQERMDVDATPTVEGRTHLGVAIPMVSGDACLGSLVISGPEDLLRLDPSDLPFLAGFAAQLAVAWDRERLADHERAREAHERLKLKTELQDLRSAMQQAKMVSRSPAMSSLLSTTRRVACTDTTVLITGESGTGKELLAQTLHQLSSRRHRPLVIVDCGAIPSTLIESELFGRERGAFTGALQRSLGRLAQADGGTVFLDEIGELPLEVQAKLLRFVQEKQLTMVGGTKSQRVDVRIVAATNRLLEQEVRDGRFREDLFYRLNVVRLRIPSLRERPEDVLYLAQHFLEVFRVQYQKPLQGLTADAERSLTTYPWPGNVRELQNRMLQAVVLAEHDRISTDDLRLPEEERVTSGALSVSAAPQPGAPADSPAAGRADEPATDFASAWSRLGRLLDREVALAARESSGYLLPLGKWLAHDLVLEAYQEAHQVIARAALLTGLPETTFARRLRQAQSDAAVSRRSDSWPDVRDALAAVLRAVNRPASCQCLLDDVEQRLLSSVLAHVPSDKSTRAAQLLGMSVPTYRRRLADLPIAS